MKPICLTVLTVLFSTLGVSAGPPEARVKAFYDWYFQTGDRYRENFSKARPHFDEQLYGLLEKGLRQQPGDGFWVDFDPFVNAQMPATSVKVGQAQIDVNIAQVKVTPVLSRGGEAPTFKVYLLLRGNEWKIQNFVYDEFNLRSFLLEGLKE